MLTEHVVGVRLVLTGHVVEVEVEVHVVGVGLLTGHVAWVMLMSTEHVMEVEVHVVGLGLLTGHEAGMR